MKKNMLFIVFSLIFSSIAQAQLPQVEMMVKPKVMSRAEAINSCAKATDLGLKWRLVNTGEALFLAPANETIAKQVSFKNIGNLDRPILYAFWLDGEDSEETAQLEKTPTSVYMFNGSFDGPEPLDLTKDISVLKKSALIKKKSSKQEDQEEARAMIDLADGLANGVGPVCIRADFKLGI